MGKAVLQRGWVRKTACTESSYKRDSLTRLNSCVAELKSCSSAGMSFDLKVEITFLFKKLFFTDNNGIKNA